MKGSPAILNNLISVPLQVKAAGAVATGGVAIAILLIVASIDSLKVRPQDCSHKLSGLSRERVLQGVAGKPFAARRNNQRNPRLLRSMRLVASKVAFTERREILT